jgi:hypothetical protein
LQRAFEAVIDRINSIIRKYRCTTIKAGNVFYFKYLLPAFFTQKSFIYIPAGRTYLREKNIVKCFIYYIAWKKVWLILYFIFDYPSGF